VAAIGEMAHQVPNVNMGTNNITHEINDHSKAR
jgi:hypothetical protein